jgi:tricorn protease
VNGQPVSEARDISDLLLNQADKQVLLHVRRGNRAPHAVIVHPISMPKNADLRYADWEQTMAAKVNQASGGKIGYLHYVQWVRRISTRLRVSSTRTTTAKV